MSLPKTKSDLIERLQTERDHWLSFLRGISPRQMEVSGAVGIWSVKDVLTHILAYEQYLADRPLIFVLVWRAIPSNTIRSTPRTFAPG